MNWVAMQLCRRRCLLSRLCSSNSSVRTGSNYKCDGPWKASNDDQHLHQIIALSFEGFFEGLPPLNSGKPIIQ